MQYILEKLFFVIFCSSSSSFLSNQLICTTLLKIEIELSLEVHQAIEPQFEDC